MIKRIKVDKNLIFLECLLLSINTTFIYDKEIKDLLKQLYILVSDKIYSSIEHNKDIEHIDFEMIYYN